MNLTEQEKEILTVLDEFPVHDAAAFIKEITAVQDPKKAIEQLEEKNLLKRVAIIGEEWFFHTKNVTRAMIDFGLAKEYDTNAYHKEWHKIDPPEHVRTAKNKLEEIE